MAIQPVTEQDLRRTMIASSSVWRTLTDLLESEAPITRARVLAGVQGLVGQGLLSESAARAYLNDLPDQPEAIRGWLRATRQEANTALMRSLHMMHGNAVPRDAVDVH